MSLRISRNIPSKCGYIGPLNPDRERESESESEREYVCGRGVMIEIGRTESYF
jgi:hypothetical protein